MNEAGRNKIVEIALTWLRTPYQHCACIKGVGVDCAQLLAGVYREFDPSVAIALPQYSPQWHMNHSDENFIAELTKHSKEITGPPLPSDIAMWKFGRCFSHGAIVIKWPLVIHAQIGSNCELINVDQAIWLRKIGERSDDKGKDRPVRFFSYWEGR